MELLARFEHIELKVAQIKKRNNELISENEKLKDENLFCDECRQVGGIIVWTKKS